MAGNQSFKETTEVSGTELALVLDLTRRRVEQLAQDGIISTVKRGKFNLCDSVQRYIKFLSREELNEDDAKLERAKRTAEVTLKASKAQIAKLEADELKGKMHRSEDVQAVTEDLIYNIRSILMSLPGRLAMDAAAAQTPAEASDVIRNEIYKAMREIANYHYDPNVYEERVRARRDWDAMESNDDDE